MATPVGTYFPPPGTLTASGKAPTLCNIQMTTSGKSYICTFTLPANEHGIFEFVCTAVGDPFGNECRPIGDHRRGGHLGRTRSLPRDDGHEREGRPCAAEAGQPSTLSRGSVPCRGPALPRTWGRSSPGPERRTFPRADANEG